MHIKNILDCLIKGDLSVINTQSITFINSFSLVYLDKNYNMNENDLDILKDILTISNILYNNTDRSLLVLSDGVYDILLEKYKSYIPSFEVGSFPIQFTNTTEIQNSSNGPIKIFTRVPDKALLFDNLNQMAKPTHEQLLLVIMKPVVGLGSKNLVNIKHNYPKLVGSLDKTKFVLVADAEEKGVANDSNVKIFERDFFGRQIQNKHFTMFSRLRMLASIKFDGVSIEADVTNIVVGARTRGDAVNDIGADVTNIFYGYRFPDAPKEFWNSTPIGMKFEAIMTQSNIARYNQLTGKTYKNGRTAIIGILGSNDAAKYRDLITLVPLATSLEMDRIDEIEFMNMFYTNGVKFMCSEIEGDYTSVLYQIKRFADEAEFMRPYHPFMYDGVVVEHLDENIINSLGRVNAINKWAVAIKFTALKELAMVIGFDWTIGQYGTITPMARYTPVEFYGAIHDKSSCHSYERFKNLNLKLGDIIEVEYVNDVMPYITKPDNSQNASNPNPMIPFITHCPCCGTELLTTDSGKNKFCPNIRCKARNVKRMVNMLDKLNLKDFAEARIEDLEINSLYELLHCTDADNITKVETIIGPIMAAKLLLTVNHLKSDPINDYDVMGSLGFESIGRRKWKLLLNKLSIQDILSMNSDQLRHEIKSIKGLGPSAANTIVDQLEFFIDDIKEAISEMNLITTKGLSFGKKIRFTGIRNKLLVEKLSKLGHDIDDKAGVTKDTDILLVPMDGYNKGSKIKDATLYNQSGSSIQIIQIDQFINNLEAYL